MANNKIKYLKIATWLNFYKLNKVVSNCLSLWRIVKLWQSTINVYISKLNQNIEFSIWICRHRFHGCVSISPCILWESKQSFVSLTETNEFSRPNQWILVQFECIRWERWRSRVVTDTLHEENCFTTNQHQQQWITKLSNVRLLESESRKSN